MKIALIALATLASPVAAQAQSLLDPAARDRLCDAQGRVAPVRLASAVLSEARTPVWLIDQANPDGRADDTVTPAEILYVLRQLDGRPFGPTVSMLEDSPGAAAQTALQRVVSDQLSGMVTDLVDGRSAPATAPYYVVATGRGSPTTGLDFFSPTPPIELRCRSTGGSASTGDPTSPVGSGEQEDDGPTPELRLRGQVPDLRTFASLVDAKPAEIGLDLNEVKDTEKFTLKGVLGLYFETRDFGIAPFFAFERTDTRDNADEIEKYAPGLFVSWKPSSVSDYIDAVSLEASYVWEEYHGSELWRVRLAYDPLIPLGPGRGQLFGTELATGSPLHLRPDLSLILDAVSVEDAGASPALALADHYFGVGGDVRLTAWWDAPYIRDFRFTVGLRQLHLSGGIDAEGAERKYGAIEYVPTDKQWIGLSLTFSEGDNDDTLQREDTVALKVTLRR